MIVNITKEQLCAKIERLEVLIESIATLVSLGEQNEAACKLVPQLATEFKAVSNYFQNLETLATPDKSNVATNGNNSSTTKETSNANP